MKLLKSFCNWWHTKSMKMSPVIHYIYYACATELIIIWSAAVLLESWNFLLAIIVIWLYGYFRYKLGESKATLAFVSKSLNKE